MLGDPVEMDFEVKVEELVETGQEIGWIEGFKAVSDIYAPLTGRFRGANEVLLQDLELLRRDPFDKGWMYLLEGEPGPECIELDAYAAVLDETLDKMLGNRHGDSGV
jgi:glycine cleavage system H protein